MKLALFFIMLILPSAFAATGNVWHLPSAQESKISSAMRNPIYEIKDNNPTIYQGFFKNGGAGGNQNGGTVNYRIVPRGGSAGSWQTVPLSFYLNHPSDANPQDQFWKAVLPTTGLNATDVVQYYITVTFSASSRETTYLYGKDHSSQTSTLESDARADPFSIRNRPGWIFHANNRSVAENDLQVRVKTGYIGPDNSLTSRWATAGAVYYTTDGSTPSGALGVASGTSVATEMIFDGTEQDTSGNGNAAFWRGTMAGVLSSLPIGAQVKYKIGIWNSETDDEKFADHIAGTDNTVFIYQNGIIGQPILTVNNVNANYSISKIYVDEIAGDSIPLNIVFQPGEANITAAEVYTNVNRRDRAAVDANGDGYHDGVSIPDATTLLAGDDSQYFKAYAMNSSGPGTYILTLPAEKTGAYRLTARWKVSGDSAWRWYTNGSENRRDHAITVSPKDARDITLYEINVLNIEATGDTFESRSTIEDMHNAQGAPHNGSNRWDLDYLKSLGANWLWFQPIHPPARDGREPSNGWGNGGLPYEPGSPYAVKNFFEVSPIFSKNFTGSPFDNAALLNPANREAAMAAWQDFVSAADSKDVGIMLDAPFNHTGFDVELAQAGVDLFQPDSQTWSKTDEIRNRDARFFSLSGNYGNRASNAANIAAGPDRFDFGKWNDVKDVFFGRYDALVEFDNEPERSSYTNEGDWFDITDSDWTANDFVKDGQNRNVTRQVWQYFARYSVHWLEKTRTPGTNRNSATEPGLTTAQRYEWDSRGIDGIRCDFGQGLPPQAWEYIINTARSKKWNYVTMSESLDGGSVTYRANRHFDILNENIVFPLASASTKNDYRTIFESRRNAYGQGLVLINNVSHDEENYSDPWQALVRFSVAGTMDGTPMIFPGQELGVSKTFGYNHYESNFGKTIPHFKRFNSMQPAWADTSFGNDQLFKVYSGIGTARNFSPSLRSSSRWFLDGDGFNSKIHAIAKYETTGASPAVKDVVLAFSNLDRDNDQQDHYKIPSTLMPLLGIKEGRIYNVKNIAAYLGSDPNRRNYWLWNGSVGYTGSQLKNTGFSVFTKKVPTANGGWSTAPYEAQYLKVYDVTPPPAPTQPVNQTLKSYAIGDQVTFIWEAPSSMTVDDVITSYKLVIKTTGNDLTIFDQNVGNVTSYTYTGTLGQILYAFVIPVSAAEVEGTPSVASLSIALLSPTSDFDSDGQSNGAEDMAGTDPLSGNSLLKVTSSSISSGDVLLTVATVAGKKYQLETSTTLTPPWIEVGGIVTATGSSTVLIHTGGAGDAKRFYQIRVVP